MPIYTYKCEKCETVKDYDLPMSHHDNGDIPTCDNKKCKATGCKLNRVYSPVAVTWGGHRGTTQKPTDSSSAEKEKNAKLKKLWDDSYVGD